MIEPTDEMRTAVRRRMGVPDGAEPDPWMEAAIADVLAIVYRPDPHFYVCTACLHGLHDRCASPVRLDGGPKVPAVCKWCPAPCRCLCHREVP